MKTVYIDPITFECHATQNEAGTYIPYEDDFFAGKCTAFIDGYRVVPKDCRWTRQDGKVFHGPMITPGKPYTVFAAAQAQYEEDLAEVAAAYQEGVDSV